MSNQHPITLNKEFRVLNEAYTIISHTYNSILEEKYDFEYLDTSLNIL